MDDRKKTGKLFSVRSISEIKPKKEIQAGLLFSFLFMYYLWFDDAISVTQTIQRRMKG
jgi:hypothetical protein